jgi:hypothetical protein
MSASPDPRTPGRRPPLALDGLPVGMPDQYGIPTIGYDVLVWAEEYLAQPDGINAGDPWRWTNTQARIVAWWYAVDQNGQWLYRRGQIVLPKGSGKALSLSVPLPTPTGWTTMGEVQVGDQLLDETGSPCTVLAVTETMTDHDCYRVSFRDGTSVVADADHLWPMLEFRGDKKRRACTVTTREIAETGVTYARPLTAGKTKASNSGVARWRTLPTPTLDLPEVETPIQPYLLGYWLGDGDSDAPRVTVSEGDLPAFTARAAELGANLGVPKLTGNPGGTTYRVTFLSAIGQGGEISQRRALAIGRNALQELGVWKNKHIPVALLRGSHKQRLELLRGLMDSDGSIDSKGRIELTLCNERLARDAVELMRTLGLYPRITESDAKIAGRVVGRRWRINVTAYADEPVFSLPRKVGRLLPRGHAIPYSQVRTVVSVEKIPSEPVRCVSVSSPTSLYLAGEGMVPTHNSPVALCCCELAGPVLFDGFDAQGDAVGREHPSPLVQLAAYSKSQTDNTMSLVLPMLTRGRASEEVVGLDPGLTRVRTQNGLLEPISANSKSREGARTTAAILDETHTWVETGGGHELAAVIRRNIGKMNARSLETTNAWNPGEDSVAELTSIYADKVAEQLADGHQRVLDEGILRFHPKAIVPKLSDIPVLRAAIAELYRDAPWMNVDRIVSEVLDPATHPATARRFYLNEVATADDALVTTSEWNDCYLDDVIEPGEVITLGFDGSKSEDSSVLVAMRVFDRFATVIGAMEKPDHAKNWEVDREFFDGLVANCFAQYSVVGFYSDVAHFESYVDKWHLEYASSLKVHASPKNSVGWDMRGRLQINTRATEALVAGIQDGSVRHDGGSLLRRHVLNTRRRPNRYGISFGKERRDSPRKVDGFAALQLAFQACTDYRGGEGKAKQRTGRVW